jgi:uncharacterized damage-inducible protein DinB
MTKKYRPGAIGAMTDEYEKALSELKLLLQTLSDETFIEIKNSSVEEDFQSARNITLHVVRSGYVYANHIRKRFGNQVSHQEIKIENTKEAVTELGKMFQYTVETFEDKWLLTDEELLSTIIKTGWSTYDLEAIIEHAIVHVLRHRLQIEKLLTKKYNNQ